MKTQRRKFRTPPLFSASRRFVRTSAGRANVRTISLYYDIYFYSERFFANSATSCNTRLYKSIFNEKNGSNTKTQQRKHKYKQVFIVKFPVIVVVTCYQFDEYR